MNWLDYLSELHRQKDLAYGDAWCRRGEAAGIFPNVARKYDRWVRILGRGGTAAAEVEPLDDTLADLLIYCVKYVLWLIERNPTSTQVLPPEVAASTSVADILTLVTNIPVVDHPAELIEDAFKQLEEILATGAVNENTADDRLIATWSLARGAWSELQALAVPLGHETLARTGPLNAESSTTKDLLDQLVAAFTDMPGMILLLGFTTTALELRSRLQTLGLAKYLIGIAHPGSAAKDGLGLVDWSMLDRPAIDYLVVTSDEYKEDLLHSYAAAVGAVTRLPRVIISGVAHLAFRDEVYAELDAPALVPSYATGYPYTRVHIFQHLSAAAANGLSGAIVEFGAFKGGTTAWLARVARRLELDVPILAFDSWNGFPPRRSVLDMYAHPRCVFTDIEAVRDFLEPLGVELVPGDISDTAAARLQDLPILLAFIDTDNYSPATAALAAVVNNLVPGGAVIFDHYTTALEHVYTLGERMAARSLIHGYGLLQVHGSGVFVRLPKAPSVETDPG